MSRSHIQDHERQMLDESIPKLAATGPYRALLESFCARIQAYEDLLIDAAIDGTLELGSDRGLDTWGVLLGEARGGLTADEYRRILRAAWRARRGDRTIETILEIIRALILDDEVTLSTPSPATVILTIQRASKLSAPFRRRIAVVMEKAVARGVRVTVRSAQAGGFRLADADTGVVGTPFNDLDTSTVGAPLADNW